MHWSQVAGGDGGGVVRGVGARLAAGLLLAADRGPVERLHLLFDTIHSSVKIQLIVMVEFLSKSSSLKFTK